MSAILEDLLIGDVLFGETVQDQYKLFAGQPAGVMFKDSPYALALYEGSQGMLIAQVYRNESFALLFNCCGIAEDAEIAPSRSLR